MQSTLDQTLTARRRLCADSPIFPNPKVASDDRPSRQPEPAVVRIERLLPARPNVVGRPDQAD